MYTACSFKSELNSPEYEDQVCGDERIIINFAWGEVLKNLATKSKL
jgi:hypothetical protein